MPVCVCVIGSCKWNLRRLAHSILHLTKYKCTRVLALRSLARENKWKGDEAPDWMDFFSPVISSRLILCHVLYYSYCTLLGNVICYGLAQGFSHHSRGGLIFICFCASNWEQFRKGSFFEFQRDYAPSKFQKDEMCLVWKN